MDGRRSQIVSTQAGINGDGIAPVDNVDPTIIITNPNVNAELTGIVNITAEGDDDQALDKIGIYLDGTLLIEDIMPDYYPYPEVAYSLDTANYSSGVHTITVRAVDQADNIQEISISVIFVQDSIPGFQITYLFTGTSLGVVIIIILYVKRKPVRKYKVKD